MTTTPRLRCAVYTRKSSDEGLDQDFNSLDAQREACEAYIRSQKELGWVLMKEQYNDGGFSGGNLERPALQRLMDDVRARKFDIIVIYKIDRLTRSLTDFARLAEQFDANGISFVSVTQQFNTTTSMGRLMLNVLLSFAQFEREITGERIRDKIAASKQKGMWMGGGVPLGYNAAERTLVINEPEAKIVRTLYRLYLELGCVRKVHAKVIALGLRTRLRRLTSGKMSGGIPMGKGHIYLLLRNPLYAGRIRHRDKVYPGLHPPIIDSEIWQRVQDQIDSNRQGTHHRVRVRDPSLLAGLLVDTDGRPYVPSGTSKKGGRRYRYYVQESVMNGTGINAKGKRLAAHEVEGAVQRVIRDLLADTPRLLEVFGTSLSARNSSQIIAAASARLVEIPGITPSAWLAAFASLIERIQFGDQQMDITLRTQALAQWLGCPVEVQKDETTVITAPIQIHQRGVQLHVIVPSERRPTDPRVDLTLIRLIVRALGWRQQLEGGAVQSLRQIANVESISEAFVGRVLRLADLAPAVIESVANGQQPVGLSAQSLLYKATLPLYWDSQRDELSFGRL